MSSSHGGGRIAFRRNRPNRIQQKSDNLNYVPDPVQLSSHHSQNVANQKVHFTTLNTNINKTSRRRSKNAWGKSNPSSIPKNMEYSSNITQNEPSLPPTIHQNGLIQKPSSTQPKNTSSISDTIASNSSWLRFVKEEDDKQPDNETTTSVIQTSPPIEPYYKPATDVFTSDVRNNEYEYPSVQGYYQRNGNEHQLTHQSSSSSMISNDFRNFDKNDDQYQRYTRPRLDIDPNSFNRHENKFENTFNTITHQSKSSPPRNRTIRKWEIKIRERENSAWFNIKRFASDIPQMHNFTPEFKPYRRKSYKKYASMIEHRSHEADDQLRQFHLDRINYTRKHADDWMNSLYEIQQPMILHPSQAQLQNMNATVTATAPVLPPSVLLLQQQQLQERIQLQEEHQRVWALKNKTKTEDDDQRQVSTSASVTKPDVLDLSTTSVVPNFIKQQWAISKQSRQTSTSPLQVQQPQVSPFLSNPMNKLLDNQVLLQAMQMRQIQSAQVRAVQKQLMQVKSKSATVFNQQLFQSEQQRRILHQQQIQQKMYSFQSNSQPTTVLYPSVVGGGGSSAVVGGSSVVAAAVVGLNASVKSSAAAIVPPMNSNWNAMQWNSAQQSHTPQPGSGGYSDANAYAQDLLVGTNAWQRSSFTNSNQSGQQANGSGFYGNGSAGWQGEQWNQFL